MLSFLIPPPFRKKNVLVDDDSDLFFVRTSDQRRTVEELIHESKLTQTYYFMLIFSSVIVTVGLLMDNMAILIAGMLVAPLLKPVLAASLGLISRNARLFLRSFAIVIISSIFVIVVSASIYYVYRPYIGEFVESEFIFNALIFILALFSGMAAAFSWTKPGQMQETLAGTAIAVTMLPPLGTLGIYIAEGDIERVRMVMYVFFYNLFTIMLGSMLVFALSGFATHRQVDREIKKQLDKEAKENR